MNTLLMALTSETIGLIIDIVIVLILVIYALRGIVKGFYESLLKLIGTAGALAAAIFGAKPALGLINGIWNMSGFFADLVLKALQPQYPFMTETLTEANRATIINQIQGADIFSILKNFMLELVGKADVNQTVGQVICAPIGYIISVIVIAVVIFFAVKLIVFLLSKLFESKESKQGYKSGTDRALGLVFGTVKGLVFIVALYIVTAVASYIPFVTNTITPYINETKIVKPTYLIVSDKVDETINNVDWNEIIKNIFNKNTETE